MPKKLFYTEKDLPQKSEIWHTMRESCIGGSDMAAVLGLMDKYTTPKNLWKRKTGKLPPQEENEAMKRGNVMEKEAAPVIKKYLRDVEGYKAPKIEPYFAKHPKYPYLGVSFDGVDIKNKFITEIKSPKYSWNFKSVFLDGIQEYYIPQVQLQLAVAHEIWEIDKAFFCSYFPDGAYIYDNFDFIERLKTLAVIDLEYDPKYFEQMVRISQVFWEMVKDDKWDPAYKQLVKEFNNGG